MLSTVNNVNTISINFVCKTLNRYTVKGKLKKKVPIKKLNSKVSLSANNPRALFFFSLNFFAFLRMLSKDP